MARNVVKRYKNKSAEKNYKVFVAILCILIVAIWVLTFIKVDEYEKGSTKYLLNKVVTKLEDEYGGTITYKRAKSVDDGLLYNIYKDDELFAQTVLTERDKKGMLGFSLYSIGETKGIQSVKILAQGNEEIFVGDKKLSLFTPVKSDILLPGLESLANHPTNTKCTVPTYNLYQADGLFTVPKVAGSGYVLVDTDEGMLVAKSVSDSRQAELKTWLEDFFNRYTNYVVLGKGFDKIKNDILFTSPIYNTVAKFKSMWDYYYDYEVEMKEFIFSDFVQYTDDLVSVRVKYHYTQTLKKQVQENKPDINVYLFYTGGKWQIVEMEISQWE